MADSFTELVQEALNHDFAGWDFSWLKDRWHEDEPSWDYRQIVQDKVLEVNSLLDMGTGGGEFLASINKLPQKTYATENYPPNIPVAQSHLAPLGIEVLSFEDDKAIPLADDMFDLVINRHEFYWMPEVWRILEPGGVFITQQVGSLDCIQLNEFLGAPMPSEDDIFSLEMVLKTIEDAGFKIIRGEEQFLDSLFYDIGAVVFFLKVITWQIPEFTVENYRDPLKAMHQSILENGYFAAKAHRFLVEAVKV